MYGDSNRYSNQTKIEKSNFTENGLITKVESMTLKNYNYLDISECYFIKNTATKIGSTIGLYPLSNTKPSKFNVIKKSHFIENEALDMGGVNI